MSKPQNVYIAEEQKEQTEASPNVSLSLQALSRSTFDESAREFGDEASPNLGPE